MVGWRVLSCSAVRDKKNCGKRGFCIYTPAQMVEGNIWPQRTQRIISQHGVLGLSFARCDMVQGENLAVGL